MHEFRQISAAVNRPRTRGTRADCWSCLFSVPDSRDNTRRFWIGSTSLWSAARMQTAAKPHLAFPCSSERDMSWMYSVICNTKVSRTPSRGIHQDKAYRITSHDTRGMGLTSTAYQAAWPLRHKQDASHYMTHSRGQTNSRVRRFTHRTAHGHRRSARRPWFSLFLSVTSHQNAGPPTRLATSADVAIKVTGRAQKAGRTGKPTSPVARPRPGSDTASDKAALGRCAWRRPPSSRLRGLLAIDGGNLAQSRDNVSLARSIPAH
jgi:hypothetical protein